MLFVTEIELIFAHVRVHFVVTDIIFLVFYSVSPISSKQMDICSSQFRSPGSSVWPTVIAVVSSSPAGGEDRFNRKQVSIAHNLALSSVHRPDITVILLNRI